MNAISALSRSANRRASLPPPASGATTVTASPGSACDEVLHEHGHCREVVDREVEEALDLAGVQVDGHDAVGARDA